MGDFCSFLSHLPATCLFFLFQDDNMSKYKLIFTKLEMCIYVVEIWFEITNGQIPSIFDRVHIIVQGIIVSCFYCQITTILIFEFFLFYPYRPYYYYYCTRFTTILS